MKCEFCGNEEPLPFICNYCGGSYCSDHRLPESHQCKGNLKQRPVIVSQATSYSLGSVYTSTLGGRKAIFSRIEVRDIILAWLALGLAFFLLNGGSVRLFFGLEHGSIGFREVFIGLGISLVTVGSGFVLHELSHKFTAQRYGYWAEFRMWPIGILLALITSLVGFIFAAPGATYISGYLISERENGIISLAGPLTNVLVGIIFLPFLLFGSGAFYELGRVGLSVNLFLALFNMLPILPLDGAKVFAWNKVYWLLVFIPLVIWFIITL